MEKKDLQVGSCFDYYLSYGGSGVFCDATLLDLCEGKTRVKIEYVSPTGEKRICWVNPENLDPRSSHPR